MNIKKYTNMKHKQMKYVNTKIDAILKKKLKCHL
jgi:hypothetical protein